MTKRLKMVTKRTNNSITIINESGQSLKILVVTSKNKYQMQEPRTSILNKQKRNITVFDDFSRIVLSVD